MNDDQLDDLKQFITTTVGQSEARLKTELKIEIVTELRTELGGAIEQLRHEMRDGFDSIAEITSRHNDELDSHEARITKLESNAA